MKTQKNTIRSVALCEIFDTKEWVICGISYTDSKSSVSYNGKTFPTFQYSNDPAKAIGAYFQLQFLKEYSDAMSDQAYREMEIHNSKLHQKES